MVHIATAVMDSFAPIRLIDAVVPFTSAYRPLWLGLGAIAFDLLLAVAITSLVRRRLGYRAWRATHWLAYASWPVALLHGLGTGSDARARWMLALVAVCLAIVVAAVLARVAYGWPERFATRLAAGTAAVILPIGLLAWLPGGPLASGWAARAGTPASLLGHSSRVTIAVPASATLGRNGSFTASAHGTVRQYVGGADDARVDISLTLPGTPLPMLDIRLSGETDDGGVRMTSSLVALGTASDPALFRGVITALNGADVAAALASGQTHLQLRAQLSLMPQSGAATGTVTVTKENA